MVITFARWITNLLSLWRAAVIVGFVAAGVWLMAGLPWALIAVAGLLLADSAVTMLGVNDGSADRKD